MQSLDVGESTRLEARFTDVNGDLADPTDVTLTITLPDLTTQTVLLAALTHPSTGYYFYDLTVTQAGVWQYSFAGTGAVTATEEGALLVGLSVPTFGPCAPWISAADVFDCRGGSDIAVADRDYDEAAWAAAAASEILFAYSGRQFSGLCEDTVRPCVRCRDFPSWADWHPGWGRCGCGASSWRDCGCSSLPEIELGGRPIVSIARVRIDGTTLSSSAYRIDDHERLVRIDGSNWPACQDLTLAATEANTFEVVYWYGSAPPASGVHAAKRLAWELYQSCRGEDCALPQHLSSMTRGGMTIGFIDSFEFLDKRRTGMVEVDLFLTAVNPGGITRQATISSPDIGRSVRRVG